MCVCVCVCVCEGKKGRRKKGKKRREEEKKRRREEEKKGNTLHNPEKVAQAQARAHSVRVCVCSYAGRTVGGHQRPQFAPGRLQQRRFAAQSPCTPARTSTCSCHQRQRGRRTRGAAARHPHLPSHTALNKNNNTDSKALDINLAYLHAIRGNAESTTKATLGDMQTGTSADHQAQTRG